MTSTFSRRRIARHRDTPPATLAALATDLDITVRRYVATNPNTPVSTRVALATALDIRYVREKVAANPYTPPEILAALADDIWDVRWFLAGNPNTPPPTLAALGADPATSIRRHVATNPNTPADTLTALGTDPGYDPEVYWHVARNPNTPDTVLRALSQNPDTDIATAAANQRIQRLHHYANTLPEPDRGHAHLLIDTGFTGWPDQLAGLLTNQRTITHIHTRSIRPQQHVPSTIT